MSNRYWKKVKRTSNKSVTLLVAFLLLFGISCGVTLAYLNTQTRSIENMFLPSHVTTKVVETFVNGEKKEVSLKNTGDIDAYIRAAVVVTWQDKDGNIYGQMPVACSTSGCKHETCGADYEIRYCLGDSGNGGWLKASDGFYYWTKPVLSEKDDTTENKSQCKTGVLISMCKPLKAAPVDGYYLNVEILGSGIQSKPTSVVTRNWSSGVSGVRGTDDPTLVIKTSQSNGN